MAAVFFRFCFATFFLWLFLGFKKFVPRASRRQHFGFVLQGLFMFCLNYILTYSSETYMPSGLVAVMFTLMIYFNIFGMKIFFKQSTKRSVLFGSMLGGLGILFIFGPEVLGVKADLQIFLGMGIALVAALCASLGNMVAHFHHQKKIPLLTSVSWSMFYGTCFTGLITLIAGHSFHIPLSLSFFLPLLYLALVGTVVAFLAYLFLVGEIGADRAVYITVISPVISLIISFLFEGLPITWTLLVGVLLCITGQAFTLYTKTHAK